jgi:hypothetical protein
VEITRVNAAVISAAERGSNRDLRVRSLADDTHPIRSRVRQPGSGRRFTAFATEQHLPLADFS